MLVRIRLHRGPKVRQKKRKNRHIALALAALLTPAAVMALVLSIWRVGSDLGFASSFAIRSGILSHWQVWVAISVAIQFIAVALNRYGSESGKLLDPQDGKPEIAGMAAPENREIEKTALR